MKKLLSIVLAMAMLVGFGALAARAVTEAEAEQFAVDFSMMIAGWETKVVGRILQLDARGKQLLDYEITEKTKAAKQAWQAELLKAEPDFGAVLNAWKKYQAVRLETTQFALTIKVPSGAWKMLGESAFKQTLKYLWSCALRYLLFGWAWMPY